MTTKFFVHELLLERLKSLKKACCGDVYGYNDRDTIVLIAASSTEVEPSLSHDPSLLLPVTLTVCGAFVKDNKNIDHYKQEHSLLVNIKDGKAIVEVKSDENNWNNVDYTVLTEEDFNDKFVVCRTNFYLDLSSKDKTADVKNSIANIVNNLSAACFQLKDQDLIINETEILDGGEGIYDDKKISELSKDSKKNSYSNLFAMEFEMLVDCSLEKSLEAPVVKVSDDKVSIQKTCLKGQCVVYILRDTSVKQLGKFLSKSVLHHLKLTEYWLVKSRTDQNIKGHLESFNVLPYRAGHLFSLIYPHDTTDKDLKSYREKIQETFLLPPNCPFFGRKNIYEFNNEKENFHLYNTHVGIATPKIGGLTSITKGIYSYHHYMQDKFNDNKWGCAYRSLQTIVSWFRHQGYSDKAVPTHRQIQECLVKIGDKQTNFIGSNQWIGSTEVGYVLETYLGVTSRYISVTSGDDLGDKGRELVHHFKTQGTPIMIGGGVLAHTILGVTWNSDSGDIRYLILDPHYTGTEEINVIQKQGWCGWKGPKFWNSKAYYNLCLPQRPLTT